MDIKYLGVYTNKFNKNNMYRYALRYLYLEFYGYYDLLKYILNNRVRIIIIGYRYNIYIIPIYILQDLNFKNSISR